MSSIKPQLDAHGVRLVGVGVEPLGVEDFMKEGYFVGEVYVDPDKQCYKDLGFKRMNVLSLVGSLFTQPTRAAISKSRQDGITGNLRGDGQQNGGTLVIATGGEMLLSHIESKPGDHVDVKDILKVLDIETSGERS
jgi:prostamide/prostaglandin F2alpha synthase